MWLLLSRELAEVPDQVLVFRPHRQSMDVSEALRTLCAKATEWSQDIVVVSMDIAAAFDYMRPALVHDILLKHGASSHTALA